MRKLKVGLSALSLIAGGLFAASAASTPNTGSSTSIFIDFGTNAQQIYYVYGLPVATNQNVDVGFRIVDTDGAGKIEGVAYVTINYTSGGSETNEPTSLGSATFIVDVTGSITSKGNPSVATVSMNMKGNGYSQDSSNTVNGASLTLKFTGTPNPDGTFSGTLNGSVKLGTKTITGNTTESLKNVPATLNDSGSTSFSIFAQLVELNNKFWAAGDISEEVPFSGSGTANTKNGTYSANLKGVGFGKGSSVKLTGSTTVATNGIIVVGTNEVPVTIIIPGTADATGKVVGQKVNATGGVSQLD